MVNEQDCLRRFVFETLGIRGEWVKLRQSRADAAQYQTFASEQVAMQFAETLAAAVLLSATIKFKGSLILQLQGSGSLKTLVAQASHDKKVRGWVRSDERVLGDSLKMMMGEGHLVLTIKSDISEPYQGITSLEADTLAGNIENYFAQSEQLRTRLWLFADSETVAGLLLQELPDKKNELADWERVTMLAETVTANELLSLDSETMLYRLFHEEKIRLFGAEFIEFSCSCSRGKVSETLLTMGRTTLEEILVQHQAIEIDCQFCGKKYCFDKVDVENLLVNEGVGDSPSATRH